jgi:hypothetical protein
MEDRRGRRTEGRVPGADACLEQAIVAGDPEAIGKFAEPDWMLIGENGPFLRDQFLEAVRNGRITHHTMSHEIRVRRASYQ